MQTVAIVGVGLIGGSFGLALREAGFRGRILGVSSAATLRAAAARGAVDEGASLEDASVSADLILLATPIQQIVEHLPRVMELARASAVVTDVGSTKRAITQRAAASRGRATFIGGHPMAGKESRGVESAEASLFKGRPWLLTLEQRTAAADLLMEWIERIGAEPVLMTAEQHDRLVAASSHLPQMISTALAYSLARRTDAEGVVSAAGPGLQDMVRLARSGADIWRDIAATNKDEILAALDAFAGQLAEVRTAVEENRLEDLFAAASGFAGKVRGGD